MEQLHFERFVGGYRFRKLLLGFGSFLAVFIVSVLSPEFRGVSQSHLFIQEISILLLLALPLSLVFLGGNRDFGLGGIYVFSLAIAHFFRQSVFDYEMSRWTQASFALLGCLGLAVVGTFMGWLISKKPQFSTPISLAVGLLFGSIGAFIMPQSGPWNEAWFFTEIMISPQIIYGLCVLAILFTSYKSIQFYWPELIWVKPVILVWLASALVVFIVFEYEGMVLVSGAAFLSLILVYFLLHSSTLGRSILAVGGNREAARLCGISTSKISMLTFGLLAAMAGLASLFETQMVSSQNLEVGFSRQLDALLAVFLGGVSFVGGLGSISGIISGVLFIASINLLHPYMGLPMSLLVGIKAGLLLIVLWRDPSRRIIQEE